jgi:hypothetical protein
LRGAGRLLKKCALVIARRAKPDVAIQPFVLIFWIASAFLAEATSAE